MCTYLIRFDPDHDWPFLIAGNRDELRARPALPPGRHWDDRADVRAGKDVLAGGTWCGINDTGVAAAILNKKQALGPAPGKRSRGEVVLDALDHADAIDGAGEEVADAEIPIFTTCPQAMLGADRGTWRQHWGAGDKADDGAEVLPQDLVAWLNEGPVEQL
ncbi:MAG: NRDE family protein, partial [Pseudomonadota bacterium]|nr:NRDE family protein [Pseudomonadota bacterium]